MLTITTGHTMMRQFEVITINGGERYLTAINTDRWDGWIGFRTVIKRLP